MDREQLSHEFGLFENTQPLLLPPLHQLQNAVSFSLAERNVRNAFEMQLLGTAEAFKAVEQDAGIAGIDALQRFFNTAGNDVGQQAPSRSRARSR